MMNGTDIRRSKTYWTQITFNVNSLNLLIVAIILVSSEIDANTPIIGDRWKLMLNRDARIGEDKLVEKKRVSKRDITKKFFFSSFLTSRSFQQNRKTSCSHVHCYRIKKMYPVPLKNNLRFTYILINHRLNRSTILNNDIERII